jgi:FPC/CPF motif-containing protein YcgG
VDGARSQRAAAAALEAHQEFRRLIEGYGFPCLGAKSVLNQGFGRFSLYGGLATGSASRALGDDLRHFVEDTKSIRSGFTTFVASFARPDECDEDDFERLLWHQLQLLHDLDADDWDPAVSSDPRDPNFSFSFAGRAFYVVGLHKHSSRLARRSVKPCLVFNPHDQFVHLRNEGRYDRFKELIQLRDRRFQGSVNPSLADHGAASEAPQYSGRHVEQGWRCPLRVK